MNDFELDNYNLNDLLKLFGLSKIDSHEDLKNAKQVVHKIHPDKSGLDKKYYIFYKDAYHRLKNIYDRENMPNNYDNSLSEEDKKKKKELNDFQVKKGDEFNRWFNEKFDAMYIKTENEKNGYSDWLKSDEDMKIYKTSSTNMNETFEKIKHEKYGHMNNELNIRVNHMDSHTQLMGTFSNDKIEEYSSDIFSGNNLKYQDVKKALTDTLIPISEQPNSNYNTNIELLQNERLKERELNLNPMTKKEAIRLFKQRDEEDNIRYKEYILKIEREHDMYSKKNKGIINKLIE